MGVITFTIVQENAKGRGHIWVLGNKTDVSMVMAECVARRW
jgi:hypothetical protein